MLEWCRDVAEADWGPQTCKAAAGGGHLAVLQYLRAHGCDWNTDTCWAAARDGHLQVLTWAREHGCDWSESTINVAVCVLDPPGSSARCPLTILAFCLPLLRCPAFANAHSLTIAHRSRGHLPVVRWAREHGCEWSSHTCTLSAAAGRAEPVVLQMLQWLRAHGCQWSSHTCAALARCGARSNVAQGGQPGEQRCPPWAPALL